MAAPLRSPLRLRSSSALLLAALAAVLCATRAAARSPCTGDVCNGVLMSQVVNGVTYCCLVGEFDGLASCLEAQTCIPAPPVSIDPLADAPFRWNFLNQGTLKYGSLGPGVVMANTMVLELSEPSCPEASLPDRYMNEEGCDNSQSHNYCARGTVDVNAQQWSQWWCQSDSGHSCPSGQRVILTLGKFVSKDEGIIGETKWSREGGFNMYKEPSHRCYSPSTDGGQSVVKQLSEEDDLCVRVKCDGSEGTWGFGVKNCNDIQYSILFSCFDPCNNCNWAGTSSCQASASRKCTCRPGFSGDYCQDGAALPVDGVWSDWSECNTELCVKTRTCTSPAPQNGGANCVGDASAPCDVVPASCTEPQPGGGSTGVASSTGPNGDGSTGSAIPSDDTAPKDGISPAVTRFAASTAAIAAGSVAAACALLAL